MSLILFKFIIWIIFGIASLLGTVLLAYFGPNILYVIRGRFSNQLPTGRPPTEKPRKLWWVFGIVWVLTIFTSALGSSLPDSVSIATPLETASFTSTPTFLAETPTNTLTQTITSTPSATQTSTLTPTNTPKPTRTFTVTPLALENYGGLNFDCIPDRFWDLKVNTDIQLTNGCLLLGSWGLHADYRRLNIILPSQDVRDNFTKDIFMPISGNVDISFSINIKEFKGRGITHVAPLFSVGICNQQDSDLKNNAILYSYRNNGSILWGIMNNGFDNFEKNYSYTLNTTKEFIFQIRSYDLTIMQKDGSSTKSIWNKTVPPEDLSAFCIHYTLPTLGELTVTLDNLLIEKK